MKKTFAALLLITVIIFAGCAKPAVWKYTGEPNFTPGGMDKISLVISDGTPYIAFDDVSNNDTACVMKFNGKSWEPFGPQNFSDNSAGYISLFISKGTPYVAFIDTMIEQRAYLTQRVMKFSNEKWEDLGTPEELAPAENSSFFVEDGTPYLLSRNKGVLKFNGENWITEGDEAFASDQADFVSMCVSGGVPYILFSDTSGTKKAMVKKLEDGKWIVLGNNELSKGEVCATSITMDKGILYTAFVDKGDAGNARVMKYENNKWSHVGKPGFSKGQSYYTTLAVNNGNLYLSYLDVNLDPVVLTLKNNSWVNAGTGLPKGQMTYHTLFVDNGIPYTAFCKNSKDDPDNYEPKASVMQLVQSGK